MLRLFTALGLCFHGTRLARSKQLFLVICGRVSGFWGPEEHGSGGQDSRWESSSPHAHIACSVLPPNRAPPGLSPLVSKVTALKRGCVGWGPLGCLTAPRLLSSLWFVLRHLLVTLGLAADRQRPLMEVGSPVGRSFYQFPEFGFLISTGYNKNVLLSSSTIPSECTLGTSVGVDVVTKPNLDIPVFIFFFFLA